jgi:polyisoprenoid-binding protein YceI
MSAVANLELFSATDAWHIDPARSAIGFRVKQRVIESVWGRFHDFDGMIEPGEQGGPPRVVGEIRVASLATDHPKRDEQLRSSDFFDAARFPVMRFASTGITLDDSGSVLVSGDLTIKETTRPISLGGTFAGTSVDQDGRESVGFDLRGELNRRDFDLSWNRVLETGALFVGNVVELVLDIVAARAPLEHAA